MGGTVFFTQRLHRGNHNFFLLNSFNSLWVSAFVNFFGQLDSNFIEAGPNSLGVCLFRKRKVKASAKDELLIESKAVGRSIVYKVIRICPNRKEVRQFALLSHLGTSKFLRLGARNETYASQVPR